MLKNNQKGFLIIIKSILIYFILVLINDSKIIQINNVINEPMFQEDKDFSQFDTKYKVVAVYYPLNYNITIESSYQYKTKSKIKKLYEINCNKSIIEKEVKLAKSHGIFGFGIIFDSTKLNDSNLIINFFAFDNDINFPFLIIFNFYSNIIPQYDDYFNQNIIYQKSIKSLLIISIKKYFKSENYIKIKGKSVLGITFSPSMKQLITLI